MKLKYDEWLSNFAFEFNLRHCSLDPRNSLRLIVRMADGSDVSVKRDNYVLVG